MAIQWSANSADCSVSPFSIALGKLDTFPLFFFLYPLFLAGKAMVHPIFDYRLLLYKFPALEKATRRNGGTKSS